MKTNNIAGLGLVALGIVLLIFGLNESHSLSSDFSRIFTGNPSDKSVWMLGGGIVAIVVGLGMAFMGRRSS